MVWVTCFAWAVLCGVGSAWAWACGSAYWWVPAVVAAVDAVVGAIVFLKGWWLD